MRLPVHGICPWRAVTGPPGAFLFFGIFSVGKKRGILRAANRKCELRIRGVENENNNYIY